MIEGKAKVIFGRLPRAATGRPKIALRWQLPRCGGSSRAPPTLPPHLPAPAFRRADTAVRRAGRRGARVARAPSSRAVTTHRPSLQNQSAPDCTVYVLVPYWNFLQCGAQGEFSRPIIRIRQMTLNSNSPKWPFGMILIRRSRVERCNSYRLNRCSYRILPTTVQY